MIICSMEPIAFILNEKEDYTKRGSARWLPLNGWLSLSSYPVLTKCFNNCLTDCKNETWSSLWPHVQNTNAPSWHMCIHDCLHSFPLAIECLHSFPLATECLHSFPLANRYCLGNAVSHGIYLFCITVEFVTTLLRPVPKIYSVQWPCHRPQLNGNNPHSQFNFKVTMSFSLDCKE